MIMDVRVLPDGAPAKGDPASVIATKGPADRPRPFREANEVAPYIAASSLLKPSPSICRQLWVACRPGELPQLRPGARSPLNRPPSFLITPIISIHVLLVLDQLTTISMPEPSLPDRTAGVKNEWPMGGRYSAFADIDANDWNGFSRPGAAS